MTTVQSIVDEAIRVECEAIALLLETEAHRINISASTNRMPATAALAVSMALEKQASIIRRRGL